MASVFLVTEISCEPKRQDSGYSNDAEALRAELYETKLKLLAAQLACENLALSVGASNSCFSRLDSTYVLIPICFDGDVFAYGPHFPAGPRQTRVPIAKTPPTFFRKCSLQWNSKLFVLNRWLIVCCARGSVIISLISPLFSEDYKLDYSSV